MGTTTPPIERVAKSILFQSRDVSARIEIRSPFEKPLYRDQYQQLRCHGRTHQNFE